MSYRHTFNMLARDLDRELQQNLDTSGANPEAVDAMHEALDLPRASTTDEEQREFQNTMRDLAESSGAEGASGGRILSGAAATAVSNNTVQSEEERKKKEDARFLDTLLAMRSDLDRRIDDLDRQYHEAIEKAQEHFDNANEADDLANKIENGTATPEEIERARDIMDKAKDASIDPAAWAAKLREIRDIQNRFGLKEADRAQDIQEKADQWREDRNDLGQKIDHIHTLPPKERPAAAKLVMEQKETVDLTSGKIADTAETQLLIDQVVKEDHAKNTTFDNADEEFDVAIMPPAPTGV